MRMTEAENRAVFVAIPCGPLVALLERLDLGIGAELHHAEGHDCSGAGMAVRAGADHRIDRAEGRGLSYGLGSSNSTKTHHQHSRTNQKTLHLAILECFPCCWVSRKGCAPTGKTL